MARIFCSVRRIYLAVYNWTVLLGWVQVLYLAVRALNGSSHRPSSVFAAVEKPLILAQSAAALEILHSALGIVRSPVAVTLPQVASRLYVVWSILRGFHEIRSDFFVTSLVISWSVTEIIRYSFFGTRETLGWAPWWLQWLRYSTFLVLYPTGIASEVALIYRALPYIKQTGKVSVSMITLIKWGTYPNALLVLGLYVPGSPHLYGYMWGQRKRALRSRTKLE